MLYFVCNSNCLVKSKAQISYFVFCHTQGAQVKQICP